MLWPAVLGAAGAFSQMTDDILTAEQVLEREIMMSQHNPLDRPGQLFHVELLFPNPRATKTKDGPKYRVSFEVDQHTWQMFQDGPSTVRLYAKMAVVSDTEEGAEAVTQPIPPPLETTQEGAKTAKETRTPEQVVNGKAWSLLVHKRGFCRCPGVWEQIADCMGADDHAKLKIWFGVEHLREVGKEIALSAFTYPAAQTMIDRAWRDAEQGYAEAHS